MTLRTSITASHTCNVPGGHGVPLSSLDRTIVFGLAPAVYAQLLEARLRETVAGRPK
jgi:hypothetical protein